MRVDPVQSLPGRTGSGALFMGGLAALLASGCKVVYFPFDAQAPTFRRDDLLVQVGAHEGSDLIPICYCFEFTREAIQDEISETGQSTVGERITAEVKAGNCACEVKNPSGKCC